MKSTHEENITKQKEVFRPLFKSRLKLVIIIFVLYLILNLLGAGCPIKFLSGFSCPGCGMTRAVTSALLLDFRSAFYFHPLFLVTPIMLYLFLFEDKLKSRYVRIAWIIIVLLFLITYLVRLLFTDSSIVSIDITSGFVLKFIHNNILGG